jgi:hypothetical protein
MERETKISSCNKVVAAKEYLDEFATRLENEGAPLKEIKEIIHHDENGVQHVL